MPSFKPLLITPGEPAGIGPDLVIALCQQQDFSRYLIVADPNLLEERARCLGLPVEINCLSKSGQWSLKRQKANQTSVLNVLPISLAAPVVAGQLDAANAHYVLETLKCAVTACLEGHASGLVTGPVHKAIINDAGIPFQGHTQFLAELAHVPDVVMTFVSSLMRVALLTTHIPLSQVSAAVTQPRLETTLRILHAALQQVWAIKNPCIVVCGLNPHAGEQGHMGREEIEIMIPVMQKLREEGFNLMGPVPADTVFTPKYLGKADVILTLYHDQGLPVVKYAAFGQVVNMTLGLPFIRTSVDHGTALDLAGTGRADASSLKEAVALAEKLTEQMLATHGGAGG